MIAVVAASLQWVVEPFEPRFMRNALAVALLVGLLAPAVGVWVVQRRLSYLGDAMSHASLLGVAIAFLLGFSLAIGALAAGLLMAVMIAILDHHPRLAEDAVIGVVGTAMFGLGVVLVSRSDQIGIDLSHFLLGQITTATTQDVRINTVLTIGALLVLAYIFRDLLAATFDPLHATLVGVPVATLRYLLLALLSVTIVVSLQTVGLLLSVAMLVTPASAARLVTSRVLPMTFVAMTIGVTCSTVGLIVAYHASTSAGATIALVTVGAFVVTFVATVPRRRRSHGTWVGIGG